MEAVEGLTRSPVDWPFMQRAPANGTNVHSPAGASMGPPRSAARVPEVHPAESAMDAATTSQPRDLAPVLLRIGQR